jgi:hypothetical protein
MEEEKATLEGMVESRDELLMEIAREIGLDCMGDDEGDEEEEEDANDRGDATTPTRPVPPTAAPQRLMKKALWRCSLSMNPSVA